MPSNNNLKLRNLRNSYDNLQRKSFWFKPLIYFVGSFVGIYGIIEVLDYFKINFIQSILKPLIFVLLISIIVALLKCIHDIIELIPSDSEVMDIESENDSLVEMLREAERHSRWAEIIKIGSAMSTVLWYTSRKKLRLVIGQFVEVAATQLNDNETLAATLIEDIGNTTMVLGYPDQGIEFIKRGISIAETYHYDYLITRGYRNLANSYAFKKDPDKSAECLSKAEIAAAKITDEAKRLEALGGIEYARCKTEEKRNNYQGAIKALDKSIQYYDELSNKYPETKSLNKDRLVKVYREKGSVLYKQRQYSDAKASLYDGLRSAQETQNHENIVRCCILIVKIQLESSPSLDTSSIKAIEGIIDIAKQHIDKTDIPFIRQEFNDICKKVDFEKESMKRIESR